MNKLLLLIVVAPAFLGGEIGSVHQHVVAPRPATVCEMSKQPAAWNHVRVRVTGVAKYGFENFVLTDLARRATEQSIWLTFGGRTTSGAIYCCPGEGEPRRSEPLVIDGLKLPLVEDQAFRRSRRNCERVRAPNGGSPSSGHSFPVTRIPSAEHGAGSGTSDVAACS